MGNKLYAYECFGEVKHMFTHKDVDGLNCPVCSAPVGAFSVVRDKPFGFKSYDELKAQSFNEIKIVINTVNGAPTISINGEVTKGIMNIDYSFSTKTDSYRGSHEYLIEYLDKDAESIKTIGNKRL